MTPSPFYTGTRVTPLQECTRNKNLSVNIDKEFFRFKMRKGNGPLIVTWSGCGGLYRDISLMIYIYIYTHTHTHTHKVSREECARLRMSVPYVKIHRYNPKHLYPKLNGYGDNGERKVWSYIYIYIYTGCPGRNVPDFGRMFLKLKYTDITQNTYIQS